MVKYPVATIALIGATTLISLMGISKEKEWMAPRQPQGELHQAAKSLADIALDPAIALPEALQQSIHQESRQVIFPQPTTEALWTKVGPYVQRAELPIQQRWRNAQSDFEKVVERLSDLGIPSDSFLQRFGFDPSRGIFPGLLTHLFLHAGYLHLAFNMLFLWIAGGGLEERWGPWFFLISYFAGGIVAAGAQLLYQDTSGIGMVGASGAIAAMMGAFLVRHFRMPLKIFYLIFAGLAIRSGTFQAPAWTVLILWLAEQLFWAVISAHNPSTRVGYGAHIGGFFFGTLIAYSISRNRLASTWEEEATQLKAGLDLRLKDAEALHESRDYDKARLVYASILNDYPAEVRALTGILAIERLYRSEKQIPPLVARTLSAMLKNKQTQDAKSLLQEVLPDLNYSMFTDKEMLTFAQLLASLDEHAEAIRWFDHMRELYPTSPLMGKALLNTGKLYSHLQQPEKARAYLQLLLNEPFRCEWGELARDELRRIDAID